VTTRIPAAATVVTLVLGMVVGAEFLAASNLGAPAHRTYCNPSIDRADRMLDLESTCYQMNAPAG
jgi:hypothetical protein